MPTTIHHRIVNLQHIQCKFSLVLFRNDVFLLGNFC